jgi:hypothetical protein
MSEILDYVKVQKKNTKQKIRELVELNKKILLLELKKLRN